MNSSLPQPTFIADNKETHEHSSPERRLPDYTRQKKDTSASIWQNTQCNTKENESHNEDVYRRRHSKVHLLLQPSCVTKETSDSKLREKKTNDAQDHHELIDFYLKIPPKEIRLRRKKIRESFQFCSTIINRKGGKIIEKLLSEVDGRTETDSFRIQVIRLHQNCRSFNSDRSTQDSESETW